MLLKTRLHLKIVTSSIRSYRIEQGDRVVKYMTQQVIFYSPYERQNAN